MKKLQQGWSLATVIGLVLVVGAATAAVTALLMNIIPAPIEFSAKHMRRWYQRKLWPTLSILGLLALAIQVGWFKFDYFSRVEPYRTGYLFLCPSLLLSYDYSTFAATNFPTAIILFLRCTITSLALSGCC